MRNPTTEEQRERTRKGTATRARKKEARMDKARTGTSTGTDSDCIAGNVRRLELVVPTLDQDAEYDRRYARSVWLASNYPKLALCQTRHIIELVPTSEDLQITLCEVVDRIGWTQFLLTLSCLEPSQFIELALVRLYKERDIIKAMKELRG